MASIYLAGAIKLGVQRGAARARCWGWYMSKEAALDRIQTDPLFFENWYDVALIEEYTEGSCLARAESWYSKQGKSISKPEEHKHTVSFLL